MRGCLPAVLGLLLAGALIMVSERIHEARIAPAGALDVAGSFGMPAGEREQIAPPDSRPVDVPTLMPTVGQGFTPAAPGQRPYVPILMYHYVRYVDAGADPVGYNLSVTPDQLSAQLDWLRSAGYEAVRMDALGACLRGLGPCPARAVALTFDDGYMDAYTSALPILQQYGYTGTFYVVTNFVGQPGYMGWGEIRALRDAGMEIGAHSITHLDLTSLGLDDLRTEVAQSGAIIAAELGAPVVSFCYPAGRFNETVAAVTGESGYTSATTTIADGPQDNPLTLPRLRMAGDLSMDGFRWMVQAYLP